MLATFDTGRFRRALAVVIAAVLVIGVVAAGARRADDRAPGRAGIDGVAADAPQATNGSTETEPDGGDEPAAPGDADTTVPLGPAAVPAPGVYRYDVDESRDDESSSRVEEREITIVGEEGDATIVQVVARSEGERQVSVLGWSPGQVLVRTTRIENEDGSARDCTWEPAFIEFGTLEAGAAWTVESSCTTDVAGLATVFVVRGSSSVSGEAELVHAGTPVRVWQVTRDRTTTITATVGSEAVEQVVREVGTFSVDPARGLVLRSDVTVTLSGAQQGETRRTSVLVEG
jgi:hypothetical protein